ELLGVSDEIFRRFPMDYKVFAKAGPFTEPIRAFADRFKIPPPNRKGRPRTFVPTFFAERLAARLSGDERRRRLYNDLIDMWAALITATTVTPLSKGLCDPFPFLREAVDFSKVKDYKYGFYMNAYNITNHCMELFGKKVIDEQ